MLVKWNNCFLCLNALNSFESNGKLTGTKKNLKSIRVSLEYLLREPGKCSNLFKLFDNCEEEPVLAACKQCLKWADKIVNLQLNLEEIQMKLISEVGHMRDAVLKRSKLHGDHGNEQRMGIQMFEEWVTEQEVLGGKMDGEKRILEELYHFQNGVYENKIIKVPFVLLEKSLGMGKLPTCPQPEDQKLASSSRGKTDAEVKFEVDADELGFFSTHHDNDWYQVSNLDSPVDTSALSEKGKDLTTSVNIESSPTARRSLRQRLKEETAIKVAEVPKRKKVVRRPKSKPSKKKKNPNPIQRPKQTGPSPQRAWICKTCPSWQRSSIYTLESHLIEHHETGEEVYKCDKCPNRTFSGHQLYKLHMDGHAGKHKQFCDVCTKRVNYGELRDHLTSCHGDVKQMPCSFCSFVTTVQDKFIEHAKKHGKNVKCFNCGEDVVSRQNLLQHLYEVHGALEPIKCPFENCKKTFLNQKNLQVHLVWHRQEGSVYKCKDCGKVFRSSTGLRKHELTAHLGVKSFPCDQCSERYSDKAQLRRHQIKFHGAEKFQCPSCDKSFNDQTSLNYHSRIHDGTMFPCDQCGRNFICVPALRRHMSTHVTERSFTCELCGKCFPSEHYLRTHNKAVHSEKKNYKCNYCEKAFTIKKYLQDHLRTHTGERPFVCDICGASYSQAGQLWGHKKKHAAEQI